MCYTAKGYVLAIVAAFFAALFVSALVSGYVVQTSGVMSTAIVHYFVAFILLGITKHLVLMAHAEKPKSATARVARKGRR